MNYVISAVIGYLMGSVNHAAIISKIKKVNLRKSGTGNLGATNVLLSFGKGFALLVMLFDFFKAFAAYKLMQLIFPSLRYVGMIAGSFAVIGHIFPFYMNFKGGKGLASFGGLVLAHSPCVFLFLLITGTLLMFIVNYSYILPFYSSAAFTVFVALKDRSVIAVTIAAVVSLIIFIKHFGNYKKAKAGSDNKIRESAKKLLGSR